MSKHVAWTEYRCPKCSATTLQMDGVEVFCFGGSSTVRRHPKGVRMKAGFLGETQARMRNQLIRKEVVG